MVWLPLQGDPNEERQQPRFGFGQSTDAWSLDKGKIWLTFKRGMVRAVVYTGATFAAEMGNATLARFGVDRQRITVIPQDNPDARTTRYGQQ